jgi:ABC-type transport system involved in cytochrome c biogenesis permease component
VTKPTAQLVAALIGFLIASPLLVLLFHKPEAVGWGIDPWLLAGAFVGSPGIAVGAAVAGHHQVVKLVVSFLVSWLFYGSICYLLLLCLPSVRRKP